MKLNKIFCYLSFLLITLITFSNVQAQDAPSGYTPHYGLRKWAENANPGSDSLNANWTDVDQVLYDLVATTDTNQLEISSDTLRFANKFSFHGQFNSTDQYDTTQVLGVDSLDVFIATPRESVPTSNDVLGVKAWADTVVVQRPASGTSGLKYDCIWIRKYQ